MIDNSTIKEIFDFFYSIDRNKSVEKLNLLDESKIRFTLGAASLTLLTKDAVRFCANPMEEATSSLIDELSFRFHDINNPSGTAGIFGLITNISNKSFNNNDGNKTWWLGWGRHRTDGPATIPANGRNVGYQLNGMSYTFKDWCKELNLSSDRITALEAIAWN